MALRNLLSTEAKTALYRMAQEAFTNIERHSGASQVHVNLSLDDRCVRLEVVDNGCGFDREGVRRSSDTSAGLGLQNMSERMSYFGGHRSIKSTRDGTTVDAMFPGTLINHEQDKHAA